MIPLNVNGNKYDIEVLPDTPLLWVIRSANNVIRGLVIQRFTPFSGIHVQQATATDDHRRRQLIVAALHEADAPCGAGVDAVAGDGVAARAAFRNTSFTLPPIPTAEPSMPS